jgi:hypothetical protein
MTLHGHIHNGVVVFDTAPPLAEGTLVRVEVLDSDHSNNDAQAPRQGGQYAGRIWMAPDFDDWPDDLKEALGMKA